jgi:hypothetical protein
MIRLIILWLLFFLIITAFIAIGIFFPDQFDLSKWHDSLKDLIITVIGAFLGFISALELNKFNEKRKSAETKKNYTQSLLRDINKIIENLSSTFQKDDTGSITFKDLQNELFYFELPIWEAMVSSGEVNLFNNELFFDDLCELAAIIKTLNNIESNLMIAKMVNSKINIDMIRVQKLEEIYGTCEKIHKILTQPKKSKLSCLLLKLSSIVFS